MSIKRVYFVRHGETEGNQGKFFQTPHTALTEGGHRGALAVALRFKHIKVDALFSSPFLRAQQTAEHISKVVELPVVTFEAFHECLQPLAIRGKGINSEEGMAHMQGYKERYADPLWRPEGAENYFDVKLRVEECIKMLEESPMENIVVVSHGAFLRNIAAYLLLGKKGDEESTIAVTFNIKTMSNVAVTECLFEDGHWQLFIWNDHAHFAE